MNARLSSLVSAFFVILGSRHAPPSFKPDFGIFNYTLGLRVLAYMKIHKSVSHSGLPAVQRSTIKVPIRRTSAGHENRAKTTP
ncbi:hypothetical protein L218DRAFT_1010771 [Marasmius fiardii PR-910]|nr:hypothetical protein L218DRAFT_1010771 [Marasmius fiardii PR-910]